MVSNSNRVESDDSSQTTDEQQTNFSDYADNADAELTNISDELCDEPADVLNDTSSGADADKNNAKLWSPSGGPAPPLPNDDEDDEKTVMTDGGSVPKIIEYVQYEGQLYRVKGARDNDTIELWQVHEPVIEAPVEECTPIDENSKPIEVDGTIRPRSLFYPDYEYDYAYRDRSVTFSNEDSDDDDDAKGRLMTDGSGYKKIEFGGDISSSFPRGVTDLPVVVETDDDDLGWAYDALGLDVGADEGSIKAAYHRLVIEKHPDQGGDAEEFKNLNRALNALLGNTSSTTSTNNQTNTSSGSGGVGDFMGDDFPYSWDDIQRMYSMYPSDMEEEHDVYVLDRSQVKNYAREKAVEKIVAEEDVMTVIDERIEEGDDEETKKSETLLLYNENSGVYEYGAARDLASIIKRGIGSQNTKDSEIKEIIKGVRRETDIPREETNSMQFVDDYLCVANGVINLSDVKTATTLNDIKLLEHSADYRFTVGIDAEFDPDADRTTMTGFLRDITRREADMRVLCEIAGECLLPDYRHSWFAIMFGPGGNGKTTFTNVLKAMLSRQNTTGISLHKLAENRFSSSRMHDKMANIYPDIPETKVNNLSAIKARTGGDEVEEEGKGTTGYDAVNRAKQIFGVNNAVKLGEATEAVKRRIVPLHLPNEFKSNPDSDNPLEKQKDPDLGDELQEPENLSALLNLALEGLMRVYENCGEFSLPEDREERWDFYESFSDPIKEFRHVCLENEYPDDPNQTSPDVWMTPEEIWQTWQKFADIHDHPTKSRDNVFFTTLRETNIALEDYHPKDDNGDQYRAFRNVSLTTDGWDYAPELLSQRLGMSDDDVNTAGTTDVDSDGGRDALDVVIGKLTQIANMRSTTVSTEAILGKVDGVVDSVEELQGVLMRGVMEDRIEMTPDKEFRVATQEVDN